MSFFTNTHWRTHRRAYTVLIQPFPMMDFLLLNGPILHWVTHHVFEIYIDQRSMALHVNIRIEVTSLHVRHYYFSYIDKMHHQGTHNVVKHWTVKQCVFVFFCNYFVVFCNSNYIWKQLMHRERIGISSHTEIILSLPEAQMR